MRLGFCPDKKCEKLLHMGGDDDWVEDGGSVLCCGKLSETSRLEFKNVVHINDYRFCIHTPKKGLVEFLINANDAFIIEKLMGQILKDYRAGLTIPEERIK